MDEGRGGARAEPGAGDGSGGGPGAGPGGPGGEEPERYSFRCGGCGAAVSPGGALRGGRVVCTCCGDTVPLLR